jgi:hypothetical protein
MSLDRRLDKVEGSLTPQQAVLVWLEEIATCHDLYDFVDHLRNQPESGRPLARLPDQLRKSIEQAMKGQPKPAVEVEVRRSVRDVAFLLYLHRYSNVEVTEPIRAWGLELGLLRERFLRLAMERDERQRTRMTGTRAASKPRPKRNTELEKNWVGSTKYFLAELYARREAFKSISSTYFSGKPILFPDLAIGLDVFIAHTERLAEVFNDLMCYGRGETSHIDLQSTLTQSDKEMARVRTRIIYMAKSEALHFMGDNEGSRRLAEELVDVDKPRMEPVMLSGVPFGER